jgi:hypothetical protein
LDQFAIDSLFRSIAEGGWAEARQVVQRLLAKLYQNAFACKCPHQILKSPYDLPKDVRLAISTWLETNGYYSRVISGAYVNKKYLLRERLGDEIGEPLELIKKYVKFNAFCRQFEPDLQFGPLLVGIFQTTEMPNHKTRTIADAVTLGAAENSLLATSSIIKTIFSAHRHCAELLPEPALISMRKAINQALKFTRQSGHHSFIPVPIGLSYFNHAMRFVSVYGEALIDFYLAVTADKPPYSDLNSRCNGDFGKQFTVIINDCAKPIGEVLGIEMFRRLNVANDFTSIRAAPTLDEALRVLIGACIVCIGIMKPSREDELTHLQRNCLRRDGEGYHLHFKLGKSGTGEVLQDADRPIPLITAKAIQLLQKLGSGLVALFDDKKKISSNLFYLPKQRGEGVLNARPRLLNSHLDDFCDYVGLDPDDLGRRWYVRIHEMRKWFLLLLFWSGKFDVLDAARWMAGHTDASHIYAYIAKEFPGEELPKLEAEYAIDRLRVLESARGKGARFESGLDALYETVLQHFKVQSLSMVPDSEWTDYVESLREAEGFSLEPHSVRFDDGTGMSKLGTFCLLRDSPPLLN